MATFAQLLAEGENADISGWDFSWLTGRATEERPEWRYGELLADRLGRADSALDLQTGDGALIAAVPELPDHMVVTEGYPPNLDKARAALEPRGVWVVEHDGQSPLPIADEVVELVSSRHPVTVPWAQIVRVLQPGGCYLAQHVGPASGFELIEFFLGPQPQARLARCPAAAVAAARAVGLDVVDLREARLRMEFRDVAAVVFTLRKLIWWVPDFSIERYAARLALLHNQIRREGAFVAHSSRYLIEAFKPVG
ncbi:MAG: SAM-dependent methyltransferase [Tetrasphaera sp.]